MINFKYEFVRTQSNINYNQVNI